MPKKVGFVNLGCPKNQIDAEIMMKKLQNEGYILTSHTGFADVVIVNTCGFIESAKQESIDNILEFCHLKDEGQVSKIIVTGCLAERYREELIQEIPELDAVVGIGSNQDICNIVRQVVDGEKIEQFGPKEALPLEGERYLTTLPYYAYIKIAEGCSNCCSYCAIPSIRGRFRSRKMEDIVEEAKRLAADGVKELIVVAQDTTRYGEDLYGHSALPELLRRLCRVEGLVWIRVLYCYPERITDELIDVFAEEDKMVKYIDIPMQHINGEVLRRMNRRGDRNSLESLIEKFRAKVPGITIRTTLIAGFPGETLEQFEELVQFVKDTRLERLGCFAYSQEEGTPAAEMDGQLDEEEKARRAEIVTEEQMNILLSLNEQMIGKTIQVIVEGYDRYAESFFGRGQADAPEINGKIFFSSTRKRKQGEFVRVLIDDMLDYDLIGHVIE